MARLANYSNGWMLFFALVALVPPCIAYAYFPADVMGDDAAIVLKYVDNLVAGNGYRFNASDPEPVFGSSSFLFTVTAAALKFIGVDRGDFLYLRLPGLIGYWVVLLLAMRIGFHSGRLQAFLCFAFIAAVPSAFVSADFGLETLMEAALLIAAMYLFYYRRFPALFFLLCSLLPITKMSLLAPSIVLASGQIYDSVRFPGHGQKRCLRDAVIWYGMPVLSFCLFCLLYFGGIIPNSLSAKLFYQTSTGWPYLDHFLRHLGVMFLAFAATIGLLLAFLAIDGVAPSFRFIIVLLTSLVALAQVLVIRFYELFFWYYVTPLLAFQFVVILAYQECKLGKRFAVAGRLCGCTFVLVAIVGLIVLYGFRGTWNGNPRFLDWPRHVKSFLQIQERERQTLGKELAKRARPGDLLFAAHGWPAYYSGMRTFDYSGINNRELVLTNNYGGQGGLSRLEDLKPAFIVCHRHDPSMFLKNYKLILLGWQFYVPGVEGEFEVYERRDKLIVYGYCGFLHFGRALVVRSGTLSKDRRIIDRTPHDYIMIPDSAGISLEFHQVVFDNSIAGVYCYHDSPHPMPASVCLEANIPGRTAIRSRRTITFEDGIACVELQIPTSGSVIGTLTIHVAASGRDYATEPKIHVRDLFLTRASF
jgi:hypothetical protein